ncbi:MAG TPA: ATP-binding cassette domain-containing protein [Planctomycetota bacterium]|jgi:molybdate transport system ATP-binding protein|nr:ATP-binding cassette domain-containing protein [Planctomycetota bacterium]
MKFEVEARVLRRSGFSLEASFTCDAPSVGIVGPSGSGKSTLLDVLAGVEAGGRVSLDGRDVSRVRLHRRRVGYVTQDPLLFPHLNVRRNLAYAPGAEGVEDVATALGIANLLDRMPRHLSGGERRRAALARAIASKPELLLLDEPFAGLDERRRREAMSLLDQARRRFGLPMVLVSHFAEEVIALTDWSVRLEAGRVAAAGPSASVLRAGETQIDNFFLGTVVSPGLVRCGHVELHAMVPESASGDVRLGCYAHDVLLATGEPQGISARNVIWTMATAVEPAGDAVLVSIATPPVRALVTREAAERLDISAGKRLVAILKATSIACLGPAA